MPFKFYQLFIVNTNLLLYCKSHFYNVFLKNKSLFKMTKLSKLTFILLLFTAAIVNTTCNKTTTVYKPPTVLFVASPSSGTTETVFVFDASETVDGTGNNANINIRWDFENDGNWDTEWTTSKSVTHQYTSDGYYTVGMQVEDSYGYFGWASRNVTVGAGGGGSGPGYPTATFTISPPEGSVGTEFLFDASGVSDNESPTSDLSVRWDYNGDSNWDTDWSTTKTANYTYSAEGNYTVYLQVKDPDNNIASTSKTLLVNAMIAMDFITVQGGSFDMGCTSNQGNDCEEDENPAHNVTISTFQLATYEVSNEQFAQFLNAVNCGTDGYLGDEKYIHIDSDSCQIKHNGTEFYTVEGTEKRCAIFITWYGASAFCSWAGGRLPTEAEWEYAARGGSQSNGYKYSGGNSITSVAWFSDNSQQRNHDVGKKAPNELGLYDMSGNAREWCSDWFDYFYYGSSPDTDPQGPAEGIDRVLRGGSFFVQSADCRVADRYWGDPVETFYRYEVGFRVARD